MSRVPRMDEYGNIRQFISQRTMYDMRRQNRPGHNLSLCGCGADGCFLQLPSQLPELTADEATVILVNTKKRVNKTHDHKNEYHNWWRSNR